MNTFRYSDARRLRRPPLIDVSLPQGHGPHPLALIVHGGGFVGGSRRMKAVKTLMDALPQHGIAAAAHDYRLFFRGGSLKEMQEDLVTAMAWLRARLRTFSIEPDRVMLVGVSAGAAVATSIAHALGPLDRFVGIYGPYDFTDMPLLPHAVAGHLLFGTTDRAQWARMSPAHHFDLPIPTGLFHGLDDGIVDPRHTKTLADFRRSRGLPVQVHLYDDIGHGYLRHPDLPVTRRTVSDIVAFLNA